MDLAAYEEQLRDVLLRCFENLAEQLDGHAELTFVDEDPGVHGLEPDHDGTVGHWSLKPLDLRAAEIQWHITESDAYSTYLALGRSTWVEVLTFPKKQSPTEAANNSIEVMNAVIAGRFREEVWYSRTSGQLANSLGRIQYEPGARWRSIGDITRPLPLLRDLIYLHETREYVPYR